MDITEAMRRKRRRCPEAEERRLANEARKARLVVKSRYTARYVDPFDALDITPGRTRGWDEGKVLSEKQRQLLLKQELIPMRSAIPPAEQSSWSCSAGGAAGYVP